MMKLFRNITLLLLSVVYFGCEQTISLDLPEYEKKLALECLLTENFVVGVNITRSEGAFGYQNGIDTFEYITDALVNITIDGLEQTCTYFDGGTQSSIYLCPNELNCVNCEASLRIDYRGETVSAQTIVPSPVSITEVSTEKETASLFGYYSFDNYIAKVKFIDNPNEDNYYRIGYSFSPNGEPFPTPTREGRLFFTDAGRQGEEIELEESFDYFSPSSVPVAYTFFVQSLSKSAFDYLSTQQAQNEFFEGPFSEPTPINGNINGGLGYFGAIINSEGYYIEVEP